MRFFETEAAQCRWANYAEELLEGWDVVACDAHLDYQGYASVIATRDGRVCALHWDYGSCSGCDGWECLEDQEIMEGMRRCGMWFDSFDHFEQWAKMAENKSSLWSELLRDAREKNRDHGTA